MRLILLGAPGAGKGTQAEILSRELGIPTISTGNILRAAMKAGTEVGLKAKSYVDSGKLVPDDVIIGIIRERLAEPDCKNGYILDGVPRTIPQAQTMEDMGIDIDCALSIEIGDDTIIRRMSGRRTCKNCSQTFHIVNNPPKVEGVCDACGGELCALLRGKRDGLAHDGERIAVGGLCELAVFKEVHLRRAAKSILRRARQAQDGRKSAHDQRDDR